MVIKFGAPVVLVLGSGSKGAQRADNSSLAIEV